MASKGFEDGYLGKPKLYFGENETDGIFYEREYEKGVSARLLEDWEKEKRENEDIKRAFQKGQDEIFQARMEQVERDCEKLEESLANALKSVDKKNDEVPAYTFIEDPPEQTQEVDLPKLLGTIEPSSFNENDT